MIEVSTPVLLKEGVNDPNINSIKVKNHGYLQSSPEYEMKHLISKCFFDIYQICKVFRDKEHSNIHKTEFHMLELYRMNYNHHDLMKEIDILLKKILNTDTSVKISYKNIFFKYFSIEYEYVKNKDLQYILKKNNIIIKDETYLEKDDYLNLILDRIIIPKLGFENPVFIYDYPIKQAILSRSNNKKLYSIGERFEVYIKGIEVGNGFYELKNFNEQKNRFYENKVIRSKTRKCEIKFDQKFLNMLKNNGLPNCSGIAIGLDRLFMLHNNYNHIDSIN